MESKAQSKLGLPVGERGCVVCSVNIFLFDRMHVSKQNSNPLSFPGLNIFFLRPGRLSGRHHVMTYKVNFRPDILFVFLKNIRTSRVCVALKTIWSYCALINIQFRKEHVHQHPIEPQYFLKRTQLPSISEYASKLNPQSNINFTI